MSKTKIEIVAHPRVHLSLIAMGNAGYRMNGGIGFAITNPEIFINLQTSDQLLIIDLRKHPMDDDQKARLSTRLEMFAERFRLSRLATITVSGEASNHHGFGTGTSIRLAAVEGLALLNGIKLNPADLIRLSGRGGTSGIGITTYFNGGFVFDAGHKLEEHTFNPSSLRECQSEVPLVLNVKKMPDWQFGMCIPNSTINQEGMNESDFFQRVCPLSEQEVYEICYHSVFGVVAAVAASDRDAFNVALCRLQSTAWKAAERSLYNDEIWKIEKILNDFCCEGVAMSSIGPTLIFDSKSLESVIAELKVAYPEHAWMICKACNSPRYVKR